ncbi:MAG: hypothetical protein GXP25_02590 [Planctomycetes bacterium]|nr:hypothetical protein [Planctomycetota bacterium]
MKRIVLTVSLVVVAGVVGFFLARTTPKKAKTPAPGKASPSASVPEDRGARPAESGKESAKPRPEPVPQAPDKQAKEEYDRHYAQGLVFLADKKYEEALTEFQKAKAASDTVEVAAEIDKIEQVLAGEQQAAQLVQEIEQLRRAGDVDQAAQKAAKGVEKYWNTSSGKQLADLRRAIDADIARQSADKKALAQRKYQQAQEYYKQNDLRNAYLVLDDTVKFSDSPQIAELHDDAKSRVDVYDTSLAAADAYMKNPDTYEDAIASLETAQKAWDTQEVRQRLDEAQKALAARRDRIAVVDFETKGNLDVPDAGGALAELLLPRFQNRFDLIERSQLKRLLNEQNLQMTDLVEPTAASDRLAKIKRLDYLVLGSVIRFGSVHVTARLVQVNSGVIDRTGKVSAPDIQDIDSHLDDLAAQLTMTPEEYQAYLATQAQPVGPEQAPTIGCLPTSQVTIIFQGVSRNDFDSVDEGYLLPEEPPATWREEQFKQEMYRDVMALGMEFMSKAQYYEASRQFEMALRIYPDDRRAMGLLAQAYRLMNQAPPPAPVRERIAVFDFMAFGNPGYPHAGREVADLLASYFRNDYDVVDRNQLFWYMKRWNVPFRDLIRSRQRLTWFGRTFGIRYFVMGYLAPAGSFEVVAKVVDTQTGMVRSRARMHVRDADEMRYRMADFSHALFLPGPERRGWIERGAERYRLLSQGQACMRENKFAEGMRVFAELMNLLDPDREHDRFYLSQARRQYDEAKRHAERSRRPQGIISLSANLVQWARERKDAERKTEASRRKLEASYRAAMDDGNRAMTAGDYAEAMRAFAAAMGVRKTGEANSAYLKAKRLADEQQREWKAHREAEKEYTTHMDTGRKKLLLARFDVAIKEFEAALAIRATKEAQSAIADAKRQREEYMRKQEAAKAEKEREARTKRAYTDFMTAARKRMQQKDYQGAMAAFSQAQALRETQDAKAGLKKAQRLLARQEEQAREEAARRERERETARPEHKPPERPKPSPADETYARLMKEGNDLIAQGEYSQAAKVFGRAYGVKKTNEAKAAYRDAINRRKAADAAEQAKRLAEKKAKAEQERREKAEATARKKGIDKDYAGAMAQGKRYMAHKQYDKAAGEFERALGLKNTTQAQSLLRKAQALGEQARKPETKPAPGGEKERPDRPRPPSKQDVTYARLMDEAKARMAKGDYSGAARLFGQAYGVKKTGEAQTAYRNALNKIKEARAAEQAQKEAEAKARKEAQRKAKTEEQAERRRRAQVKAEAERRRKAEEAAKKAEADRKARKEKENAEAAARARAAKAEASKLDLAYQRYMDVGQKHMQQGRYRSAIFSFTSALKLKRTKEAQAAYDDATRKLAEVQAGAAKKQKEKEQRKAQAAEETRRRKEELERRKREAAEAAAQKARTAKEYSNAINLGKRYLKVGNYDRAIEAFTQAIGLKSTSQARSLLNSAQAAKQAAEQQAKKPPVRGTERPPAKEAPKTGPGKAQGPDPGTLKAAAAVQNRFAACKNAAAQALRKGTYEQQAAELSRTRNELIAARREWKRLRGLDPATNKALKMAYNDAQKAVHMAEVQAKKARKGK